MGKLAHFLHSSDPDQHFAILTASKKAFSAGGPRRIPYTLPSLLNQAFVLAKKFYARRTQDSEWQAKAEKIFQFCHSTLSILVKADMSELPLRLYLQGASTLDGVPFGDQETVAYEFFSQAFSLYEDEISDSR